MPATSTSSAASLESRSGANPPSSPTAVEARAACSVPLSAWKTSVPIRSASEKLAAPAGTTMNSWKSTLLSACAPPLSTFIIGTGRTWSRLGAAEDSGRAAGPPRPRRPARPPARRRGSRWRRAATCSGSRRARSGSRSIAPCSAARAPSSASAISPLTLATARATPLPPQASPPSRSSTASNSPVEAPEGTAARPRAPESSTTSTSTVGLPRESRIWRAWMRSIDGIRVAGSAGRTLRWQRPRSRKRVGGRAQRQLGVDAAGGAERRPSANSALADPALGRLARVAGVGRDPRLGLARPRARPSAARRWSFRA